MTCNFDRVSDWEKDFQKKLAAFQSLLMEKHLLNDVSPEERREFESQLESATTDVLIAFEELVNPYILRDPLFKRGVQFSLNTGIKEREDIPQYLMVEESGKTARFGLLMKETQCEGDITYLDKICACIKNRRFPANKIGCLLYLVNYLNAEQIESNDSILRDMVEMAFKETEQSVFRGIRLLSLVTILNKTSMMESYSSRLKSLISDIINAMEADDEYEYHMWAFFNLVRAIKHSAFLDYFSPRLEQLFSKLLKVEYEKDPMFWDYWPFDYVAIEQTKLLGIFEEWSRKHPE